MPVDRNTIGSICVEAGKHSDNLAIALATYFSDHCDRPEDDEEDADNYYWGEWVMQKTDEALDLIAAALDAPG
jgi:hypothetical protein